MPTAPRLVLRKLITLLIDVWQDKAYVASEKYKEQKTVVEIAFIMRVSRPVVGS